VDNYLSFREVRQTPEFTKYYEAAGHFCLFLEESNSLTTLEFLEAARGHLLPLYAVALAMPLVDLQSDKEYEDMLLPDDFQAVILSIAERLGSARYYWHVLDPTNDFDTALGCGDLLDDLGDIYKDLKNSLILFSLGKESCEENALWQLKFDFDAHWGEHCVNALSAIHFYLKKLERPE
jgi:hypothetical protein